MKRQLLLSLVSTVIALGLAWGVLRSLRGGPGTAFLADRSAGELVRQAYGYSSMFTPVPDPDVDMMFLPGLDEDEVWATGVPLRANQAGLRWDRELAPKAPGVFRVVLLGDSFVAGTASTVDEALPAQLERLLQQACATPCEVVPAAVGGWNLRSEIGWLEHNLHTVQPDCVVHVLCGNDLDSGFGFTLGNVRTAWYDAQTGGVHLSTAAPRIFHPGCAERGLICSYLLPISRERHRDAARRMRRLDALLQESGAGYYLLLLSPWGLGYGLSREAEFLVDRCWIGPRAAMTHTHAPLDGHPDGEGHAGLARTVADILAERGVLELDPAALDAWGRHEPLRLLAEIRPTAEMVRRHYHVDALPSAVDFVDSPAAAAPTVVGGVHAGGTLAREAVVALRREPQHRRLVFTWRTPDYPALRGGEIAVFVDGERAGTLRMDDSHGRNVVTSYELAPGDDALVELRLVADRFYTDPVFARRDGLFGPMPRAGVLERVALRGP